MNEWFEAVLTGVLAWMALPKHGLSTVFVVAFLSATLLPMGSEPAVFGLVQLRPDLMWQAIGVATVGNTLGGALDWWLGYGAKAALHRKKAPESGMQLKALQWLQRLGPKACLLSWLPLVGDPLCAVAGWLRLPFLPCLAYMAVGKFARYVLMTHALVWGADKWFS
jgi:membrane protein YqaA with SNARE-associated domain